MKRIFKYYWKSAKKYGWIFYLVLFTYTVAITLASVIGPMVLRDIIDTLTNSVSSMETKERLMHLVGLFAIIAISRFVFFRLGEYGVARFEAKTIKDIHTDTFRRLLQHSYNFYTNTFAGSLVAKAKRFASAFERITDIITWSFYSSFIRFSGILVVIFSVIPKLGFVFLGWAVIYLVIIFIFLKHKRKYDLAEAAADSKITSAFSDVMTNILNLKIFGSASRESQSFGDVAKDQYRSVIRNWNFDNLQSVVRAFLMIALDIGVLYFSITLWLKGEMTVGTIVLIQAYMVSIFDSLRFLGNDLTRFVKELSNAKEMADIFDQTPDILDPENPEALRIKDGEIKFENVSFQYVEDLAVFENFSLNIKAGEKVGLVGHSGSGKSTITKILLRFADVKGGSITIDGQDVRNITQDDLRSKISYVPQDPILFHRSIAENIGYSKPDASLEEIQEAARKAHADEFISKLPKSYDTLVGERGVKLSGGERQRVAIARAMLKDAPILVLDEATSSLDSTSESYIQEAFGELMKGKTTLVIAHRLSTIQKMDRIIVLDQGKIVEEGTHSELLDKGGKYAELWNHQTGGFLNE